MGRKLVAWALALTLLTLWAGPVFARAAGGTPQEWLSGEYTESSPAQWAENILQILGYADTYGLGEALKGWLDRTAWKDESRGSYLLTLPDIKKLSAKSLPKYEGQDPLEYVREFSAALSGQIAAAKAKKPAEFTLDDGYGMVDTVRTMLAQLDAYCASAFKSQKVYQAISRICLPLPAAEAFQAKQFLDKSQAPLFPQKSAAGVQDNFDTLMDILARNLAGQGLTFGGQVVITAQQARDMLDARFPLFLRTISQAKWSMTAQGASLSYKILPLDGLTKKWYGALVSDYMNIKVTAAQMEDKVDQRVKDAWSDKSLKNSAKAQEFVFSLQEPAQAILQWASTFASFEMAYESLQDDLSSYTQEHDQPHPMPKTGLIKKPASGRSRLAIRNQVGAPMYVRVYRMKNGSDTGKGTLAATAFIRAGAKVSMSLAPGYYRVTSGEGKYWYGEKLLFGDDGDYYKSDIVDQIKANYILTITIFKASDDREGEGLTSIDRDSM